MKYAFVGAALLFCGLISIESKAQQLFISSLSDPGKDLTQTFDSTGEAYQFTTDNNSYNLAYVAVLTTPLKTGFTYVGSLYNTSGAGPIGGVLATTSTVTTLNQLSSLTTNDPGLDVIAFEFGDTPLLPNTTYDFVAGASVDVAYEVWGSTTPGFDRPAGGSWNLASTAYAYVNGQWVPATVAYTPALGIAAAIPESGAFALSAGLLTACAALIAAKFARRAQRSQASRARIGYCG